MDNKALQHPHLAKELGYVYPDNLLVTDSGMYGKLDLALFSRPKPEFVPVYSNLTGLPHQPTGIVISPVEREFTRVQKETIKEFLRQQDHIKLKVANSIIPFYNEALNTLLEGAMYNSAENEVIANFEDFGGIPLTKGDVSALEERLYLHELYVPATNIYGDFYLEFEWNLDPEHTVSIKFEKWEITEVDFTSEMSWS